MSRRLEGEDFTVVVDDTGIFRESIVRLTLADGLTARFDYGWGVVNVYGSPRAKVEASTVLLDQFLDAISDDVGQHPGLFTLRKRNEDWLLLGKFYAGALRTLNTKNAVTAE